MRMQICGRGGGFRVPVPRRRQMSIPLIKVPYYYGILYTTLLPREVALHFTDSRAMPHLVNGDGSSR